MEDIYLFGAGQKGRYWLRCLKSFGVMPSGFIDNNPELAGSLVDGVQVYGAAHSKAFSSGYILVTCNDEEEICRQLLELEFPEEKIVHGLHNITNHILYYAVNRIPSISSGSGMRKSLSGRKVLFDLQNGMVLGGVEAWSYELAGRLCQQGIQGMYLTTETGLQRVGQAVYPVQVFRFEQPLEEGERIETYVEGITEHLPCTVICNFPWYIFWAACIARKRYPDQVRIIAVQHSDDATYYKSYGLWKEYIDKCLIISSLIEKKILSCGVEGEKLARLEWKVPCEEKLDRMWSPEDRRLQIGYAGRITVTQKRVDLLPVLAAELRRRGVCFQMNIAGTGNYAEALEEKIKEENLQDHVVLAGYLEREAIPLFWRKQDIMVSCSEWEGHSISQAEAMAGGAVPVLTDVSGVRDDVADGSNGFVVEVGNVEALADRICRLYRDRGMLKKMGQNAHDTICRRQQLLDQTTFWTELLEEVWQR